MKNNKKLILTVLIMMLSLSFTLPTLAFGQAHYIQEEKHISSGYDISFILTTDGVIWGAGRNNKGQLGDTTTINKKTFLPLNYFSDIVNVSSGQTHTLVIRSDGTVWGWGDNSYGRLGDGTTTDRTKLAVQAKDLENVVMVSAGFSHSLALKSDGTVWAWGRNTEGQLGDGTISHKNTPVQVKDLTNVVAISAGYRHSLALKSDGTVWAWGNNDEGELGDGSTVNKVVPVQILSGVSKIACGVYHSIALKTDGTVWTWGKNARGQIGNGDSGNEARQLTPYKVEGLTSIIGIAGGESHTIVLKSDGTLWVWGYNGYGQFGNGKTSTIYGTTPEQVPDFDDVVEISSFGNHNMALKSDGTVWVWGHNFYGSVGDGTTNNSTLPFLVTSVTLPPQPDNPDPDNPENPQPENPGGDQKSDDVDFELESGELELLTSPIRSFGKIKLGTQIKTYKTSFESPFNIKDLRGTNEGWRLDVSSTQFKVVTPSGGFAEGTKANILPVGSLSLAPLENISRVGTGTGGLPTSQLTGNTIIDDGIITVARAKKGDGAGEFNLTFPKEALFLVIDPATAKMDRVNYPNSPTPYEATVTWTLVSAP